jgi:hypothetical protein
MPSPLNYIAKRLASIIAFPKHAPPVPADAPAPAPEPASSRPGPKTAEGKERSSMKALRHGLTARTVVLPGEDKAAYDAFPKELVEGLDAQTPLEREFAQTVADSQWRIKRIRSIEDGLFAQGQIDAENAVAITRSIQAIPFPPNPPTPRSPNPPSTPP